MSDKQNKEYKPGRITIKGNTTGATTKVNYVNEDVNIDMTGCEIKAPLKIEIKNNRAYSRLTICKSDLDLKGVKLLELDNPNDIFAPTDRTYKNEYINICFDKDIYEITYRDTGKEIKDIETVSIFINQDEITAKIKLEKIYTNTYTPPEKHIGNN